MLPQEFADTRNNRTGSGGIEYASSIPVIRSKKTITCIDPSHGIKTDISRPDPGPKTSWCARVLKLVGELLLALGRYILEPGI